MVHDTRNSAMINSIIPRRAEIAPGSGLKVPLDDGSVKVACREMPRIEGKPTQRELVLTVVGDAAIAQLAYIMNTYMNTRCEDTPVQWSSISDLIRHGRVLDVRKLLDFHLNRPEGDNQDISYSGPILDPILVEEYNQREIAKKAGTGNA